MSTSFSTPNSTSVASCGQTFKPSGVNIDITCSEGISRVKKHQLGIKGDVVACLKISAEVKAILHADMVEKEIIKRGIKEVLVQLDADDTNEIEEISRIRSGKRLAETSSMAVKRTKGPLDLVFKKTKDTSLNDACDK
ncbi:unnamed protein product [Lathyrus oleraceus]